MLKSQFLAFLRKATNIKSLLLSKLIKLPKLALVLSLGLYLTGYQPTLAIPPIKKSVVEAEFIQEQTIKGEFLSEPFDLPHPGYISSYFNSRHPGIDIATGLGMPVRPITSGTVVEVSLGIFGLGHHVTVLHEQNIRSTYAHMGRVFVKVGDLTTKHSILGEVGMTGRTSGPHTHLEITKNGVFIDPSTLLPELPNITEAWKAKGSTDSH
ncbi:MAG: M23 family metallopeptidase [Candidatus Daviesbacteria bacterium]|nr:M23 family metallopeptidase [Candidatus Daviesbacteria bacterium]